MNTMTCREFDESVHGFVRMELLDVVVRELLLDHAAHCSSCAERMGEAKLLAELTEAAAALVSKEDTPPRVETALLSEFRKYNRRAIWRHGFDWIVAGAIAATVLFFVWSYAGRQSGPSVPVPRKDVSSQSKAPLDASIPATSQPDQVTNKETENVSVAEKLDSGSPVIADFVPVPFTDGIAPDDPGMVVRVQLTRASLAQLGYPVAETPDEGLIRADVLVGEDGWPRGVRLVQ
jgi:hypothetical protein